MCTDVEIRRPGMRDNLRLATVRELSRHLRVIVPGGHLDKCTRINRMATHCLCPVDVAESARRSGYKIIAELGGFTAIVLQLETKRSKWKKKMDGSVEER